jgi:hypothetical protein
MFGSVFNQRTLPQISGWFCALLVIALLMHPFGLSAEERQWQSNNLTYSSPTAVPALLATLDQSQRLDRVPVVSLLPIPLSGTNLLPSDEAEASSIWLYVAVIPPATLLPAPFLPRPPPVHLQLPTA